MLENELEKASKNKLDDSLKSLDNARKGFIHVSREYKESHNIAEDKVMTYIKKFLLPEEKRARVIRKYAKKTYRQVYTFRNEVALLKNSVLIAELNKQTNLTSLKIKQATNFYSLLQEFETGILSEDPLNKAKSFINDIDEYHLSIPQTNLLAALSISTCANAYETASDLITIRYDHLQSFIDNNIDIKKETIITAIKDLTKNKATEEIYGLLKETLKNNTNILFDELPIVRTYAAMKRIREKIVKLKPSYTPRGPVDDLFELADQLTKDDYLFKDNVQIIHQASTFRIDE